MKTHKNSTNNNPNVDIVNNLVLKSHETDEEYFEALHADYTYLPEVSYVDNAFSELPKTITIPEVVDNIKNGTYKEVIDKIRKEESNDKRKELKLTLPAIMFGGAFEDRSDPEIVSRLICIDFDYLGDLDRLRKRLKFNQSVYMFFTSPSGKGLKVIMRTDIQNGEEYKKASFQLFSQFEELKFSADTQKQSINDLCFYSYDKEIYFNPQATIWRPLDFDYLFIPADHELPGILEGICSQLEEKQIDLTKNNRMSYDIGLAIANKLGEDGRLFYHRICKLSDQYDEELLNVEYNSCIKNFQFGSISSLIYLADASGINITPTITPDNGKTDEESNFSGLPLNKENILLATDGGLKFYKFLIPNLRGGQRTKKNVKNPLYNDTKAGMNIYKNKDRWYFHDYGNPKYSGDVFNFSAIHYDLNIFGAEFYKMLQNINDDLNLGLVEGLQADENPDFIHTPEYDDENSYKVYFKRDFSKAELNYWGQFGITKEILLKFNVRSVKSYKLQKPDKREFTFRSNDSEPIFAYVYGEKVIKLYKPLANEYKHQWIGKKNDIKPFGYEQCMEHDPHGEWDIIITGGEKDVMTLQNLGYFAICLNSETSNIPESLLKELKHYYRSVLVLYDIDETGIRSSKLLTEKNSLQSIFLPEEFFKGSNGKDVSDYISQGGSKEALEELIEQTSKTYIEKSDESDKTEEPPIPYDPDGPITPEYFNPENWIKKEKKKPNEDTIEKNDEGNKEGSSKDNENQYYSEFPIVSNRIIDELPSFFKAGLRIFEDPRERDVYLYSMIGILSGALPNVYSNYDGSDIFPNLNLLILAPPSSKKGVTKWARRVGYGIHTYFKERYETELEEYIEQSKSEDGEDNSPIKPSRRLFFIPANSSASSFLISLRDSEHSGILFETEADTLSITLANDWGNYSDSLRKAFHHEPLSIARKGNGELIEIEEPKLSVVLTGTPGQVRKLIPDVENGLFSRFMFYTFKEANIWKDTLKFQNHTVYSEEFKKLGGKLKEFFINLESSDTDIKFSLTEDHQNLFRIKFSNWLEKYVEVNGDEFAPTVKRMGLISYRIAMILSVIRVYEKSEFPEEIICSDKDFNSSMIIAENLLEHGSSVFNLMSNTSSKTKGMPENKANFFNKLNDEFTTQESYFLADKIDLSRKTAEKYIKDFIEEGIVIRIKHGLYRRAS